MIEHGVALMRLSSNAGGCGGRVEEFYAVVFADRVLPTRFASYAAAFKHLETLWVEAHADVA